MWRCSNMSNILLEDIFDSELDEYYREFSKEETFEYIDKLKEHNNIENQKYNIPKIYSHLRTGEKGQ